MWLHVDAALPGVQLVALRAAGRVAGVLGLAVRTVRHVLIISSYYRIMSSDFRLDAITRRCALAHHAVCWQKGWPTWPVAIVASVFY
jgi:hypothetical protein